MWAWDKIQINERPAHGHPGRISNKDDEYAYITIPDEFWKDVYSYIDSSKQKLHIPTHFLSLTFISIVALCVLAFAFIGWPKLMVKSVPYVPEEWFNAMGEYALSSISSENDMCLNADGVKALDKLVLSLSSKSLDASQIKFNVTVPYDKSDVNAYALVGNNIILPSALIDFVNSESELSGVISHEIGHIMHKHSEKSIMQAIGSSVLMNLIFMGSGVSGIADMAVDFEKLYFSRLDEEEADRFAVDLLNKNGIGSNGLASFFMRLMGKEEEDEMHPVLLFLSTHPPTDLRINLLARSSVRHIDGHKILSNQEWLSLKDICSTDKR